MKNFNYKLALYLSAGLILGACVFLLWKPWTAKTSGPNDLITINNARVSISNAQVYIGSTAPVATSTPPTPTPPWAIQSIDVMKYTKDNICTQSSTSTINTMLQNVVDLGANYVSISSFYDNPTCANSLPYLTKWVTLARAKGLKIWFRMKDLSFEGDYSTTKAVSPDGNRHKTTMTNWEVANAALIHSGDIFTPFAEIQNGGVNGITYCGQPNVCQFTGASDFNSYIRSVQATSISNLPAGVLVGYYGFDGFIVAGLGNADHQGTTYLETATINAMGEVTLDHYPESIGHTFAQDLPIIHTALASSTLPLIIGEYGTINAGNQATQVNQINIELPPLIADPTVKGFNYWNLGPAGGEALINNDFTIRPGWTTLKSYFQP